MRIALVLFAAVLGGCAAQDDGTQVLDGWTVLDGMGPINRDAVIYRGDAPDAPEHDAVVSLHYRSGSSVYRTPFCTGTLIDQDVVLTAAHCLDEATGGSTYNEMETGELAIYVGDDPSVDLASHVYAVSDIEIYSSYNRVSIRNDAGLVRLTSDITEGYDPVPPLPASEGFSTSDIGENLNFAGFGYTETGSYGEKMQVDLPLGGLGCTVSGCPTSGDSATQISYSQSGGYGPCSGDSGGPAFVTRGGVVYVGGITSWGDSACRSYGVSTRVDAFESWWSDWIDTGSGDGGGTTDPYCGDGDCGDGESCDGRFAGTTACSADCDSVTSGPRRNRYCYSEGVCYGRGCP